MTSLVNMIVWLVLMLDFQATKPDGAWQVRDQAGITHALILADGHYALTSYDLTARKFVSTRGGKYRIEAGGIVEVVEFNTIDPLQIGTEQKTFRLETKGTDISLKDGSGNSLSRVDDGGPGALAGAWVITGRMGNGELRTMTPGARRTMKILSGSRFQWIAYNVETKEFSGTGGGTYTTVDGKYTENIEFFSRDNSRVGASLSFDFAIENKTWRHKGLSSRGEAIDEVWSRRVDIGL
jgi:hypothetical protein